MGVVIHSGGSHSLWWFSFTLVVSSSNMLAPNQSLFYHDLAKAAIKLACPVKTLFTYVMHMRNFD